MNPRLSYSRFQRVQIPSHPQHPLRFPCLLLATFTTSCRGISTKAYSTSSSRMATAATEVKRRDSQTLTLPDGRVLGFAEYGSPAGKPIFFFHGFPSSRLEAAGIVEIVHRPDLRIIAPERPGFGLSTFDPRHRVTDWPADVAALAAHLGLTRFAILGGSGGAPYALACVRALPPVTISAVGLLAPAAPWRKGGIAGVPRSSRITALMGYYCPGLLRVVSTALVNACRWLVTTGFVTRWIDRWLESSNKEKASSTMASSSSSSSSSPTTTTTVATTGKKPTTKEIRIALLNSIFETFRQGTAPMVRESQLLTWEGWGFTPEEVLWHDKDSDGKKILIWHGVRDGQSPIHMVRDLARRLPRCELREIEGETHFTMAKHLGRILEELVPEERE